MCRLIETIQVYNGTVLHGEYHLRRIYESRKNLLGCTDTLDLDSVLEIPQKFSEGRVKCRVIYDRVIHDATFSYYTPLPVKNLKLVYSDTIEYSYKYENREEINRLRSQRGLCDEILIVKHERITDTSFSNVAFFDGNKWITPANPLLKGTCRQRLLDNNILTEGDITVSDVPSYTHVSLINSMLQLHDDLIPIDKIT